MREDETASNRPTYLSCMGAPVASTCWSSNEGTPPGVAMLLNETVGEGSGGGEVKEEK